MPELMVKLPRGSGSISLPLKDCDWVMTAPCGHVQAIMMAAWDEEVLAADEDAAWKEMLTGDRNRARAIATRKRQGWIMQLLPRAESSKRYRIACDHDPKWTKPREDPNRPTLF